MGFASISTDVYLPAMPAMSENLKATHGMIEWTVSGYLIGFSLGQLLWGPISDRYGRRLPVAAGLLLFIIGSAGCALSGNIWVLIGWRIIQAVGACASVVLTRAMVRDLYEGPRAAQMMSTLITVMAIAPLIGPLAGGQILIFAGWRWIFWFLVVVGVITLIVLFTLPETLASKCGIIGTGLVGLLADGTPWPMCAVIAVASIGGVVCAWLVPDSATLENQSNAPCLVSVPAWANDASPIRPECVK